MKIELVEQEQLTEHNAVMTKVVFSHVESQCILARLAINALGRPGVDTDLELIGSGEQWTLMWTYPALTLEATKNLVATMIQR